MKRLARNAMRVCVGIVLLAASLVLLQTIPALPVPFHKATVLQPLGIGFGAGVIWFGLIHRLTPVYVVGHELTHWFTAKLFRRRTGRFRISMGSGSVAVERPNVWIVLAPYVVPIYTLVWIGLYGAVRCFHGPVSPLTYKIVWGGIGLSYAFHLVLTFFSLRRAQSDLNYQGRFLSLNLIAFANLLLIFLAVTAAGRTWSDSTRILRRTVHHNVAIINRVVNKASE